MIGWEFPRLPFAVVTAILAVVTLLPLWRNEHWLVRSMDFPRLQLFVLLGLLVVFEVLLLDLSKPASVGLMTLGLLCLAYQGWWIIPYTRLFPCEVKSSRVADADRTIAIMTANVLITNRNAAGLIALVRAHQPDILVTLESDLWWQAQLDSLEGDYLHTIKCPLDNMYGMHVYSRLPLSDCLHLARITLPFMRSWCLNPLASKSTTAWNRTPKICNWRVKRPSSRMLPIRTFPSPVVAR